MYDGSFKIADLGVSRILDDQENSVTLLGTPSYFPPEFSKFFIKGG